MKKIVTLLLASLAPWSIGHAMAAKTITLDQMKATLVDLGYEPKVSSENTATIENLGPSELDVKFAINSDNSLVNVYTNWTIPSDKQAAIPAIDLLKANNSAPFAFALYDRDGGLGIDLEASYDASLVNKVMLRRTIDQLMNVVSSEEDLWNSDKWAAPAATAPGSSKASYKALQDDADAAWEKGPLAIQNMVFTQDKVEAYRAYVERPGKTFAHGEKMHLYFEPVDYVWKPVKDGLYNVNLSADFLMKTKDGATIVDNKDAVVLTSDFHYKMKVIDFELNVGLGDSLPMTDYTATVTLHDRNSGKSLTTGIPFSINK